jgi:hypothetical protein
VSIPNRIYRIAKSYLNQARERIETLDAELAEQELHADPGDRPDGPRETNRGGGGGGGDYLAGRNDTSPEAMMRRAEQRIRAARSESLAREETVAAPKTAPDPQAADYRVLGVHEGADWSTVQAAYEKLARRCDPRRFPENSEEQRDAERILERVNVAYESLRKRLDPMESRFGKLEF